MPEIKKMTRKEYFDERASSIEAEREGARSFDKAILTLTAGAFGLSLTFVQGFQLDYFKGLLVCSYVFFIGSMLCTLISFLTSQEAYAVHRKNLKLWFETGKKETKNAATDWTGRLNVMAIIAFIVGIGFITLFVSLNLLGFKSWPCWCLCY